MTRHPAEHRRFGLARPRDYFREEFRGLPSSKTPIRLCTSAGTPYSRTISRQSRSPQASRWTMKHHSASPASWPAPRRQNGRARRRRRARPGRGRGLTAQRAPLRARGPAGRAPPPAPARFRNRGQPRATCVNERTEVAAASRRGHKKPSVCTPSSHARYRCHVVSVMPALTSILRRGVGCRP